MLQADSNQVLRTDTPREVNVKIRSQPGGSTDRIGHWKRSAVISEISALNRREHIPPGVQCRSGQQVEGGKRDRFDATELDDHSPRIGGENQTVRTLRKSVIAPIDADHKMPPKGVVKQ
jgi:hypothetical protein